MVDGEEICPRCGGLGVIVENHVFLQKMVKNGNKKHCNLQGFDVNKTSILLPKSNEALTFCPDCYNGVVKRCKYCHKIIPKGRLKCDCAEQRQIDELEEKEREKETLGNAIEKPASEFEMYYSDCFSDNDGYFEDFDEFFDNWKYQLEEGEVDDNKRPEFVYGTFAIDMKIDADDIVENALEDFYEDARWEIADKSMEELQNYLDKWCEECGVGQTFYYDKQYKVRIPWEEYE